MFFYEMWERFMMSMFVQALKANKEWQQKKDKIEADNRRK